MRKILFLLLAAFCLSTLYSQTKKKYPSIDIPFKKYVLDNGLTLIVHEDHKLPIASFNIWYHVGSKNEKIGKTGFAHLFEHIMFTTTEHWSNYDEVMQTVGGANNNGTTSYDRTNYFETFASNGLDRVLWLEADRMGYLLKGLDSVKINIQRGVVQNEKRQGMNQPYSIADELTVKATYPAGHPYSWQVIGSMEDLAAASIDDVKEWFRTYYGPNNAIVAIAGDVKAEEVLEQVKKYFGDIPAGPPIAKFTNNIAKMTGTVYQQVDDRVPQARIQKTWNVPGWGSKEITHLNLLGDILTNGKSSRLYKRLVLEEDLASNVFSYSDDKEIGGQFYLFADAKPNADLSRINTIMNEELKKIFATGVTEAELDRTKTNYFAQFLKGLETLGGFGGKSDVLAQSETYGKTPDAYKRKLDLIKAATTVDIKKASIDWLSDGEYNLQILPYGNFTITASALDRSVMPSVAKPALAKFPPIKTFTLSNGLTVYLVERHELPLINMLTSVKGGFSADNFTHAGTAKLTGNMLLEGTATRSASQISDLLNTLGSTLNTNTSIDNISVNMSCLATNFDASLNLYADILLNATFPKKEFDRVKTEQLLEIAQEKASPGRLARRIMPSLIYSKDHPYNNPLTGSGYTETVNKINRADAVKFYQTWFAPNNCFIVVAGNISEGKLKVKLEKYLAGWKQKSIPKIILPEVALAEKPRVYLIDKPGAEQSTVYASEIAPSAINKDIDAFSLMNTMLGGSFISRLNMNLREDKHWTYGAGSGIAPTIGPGIFSARTAVQTDKTKESLLEILKELTQITGSKPIAADELSKEQTSSVFSIPGYWETNSGVANFLFESILYNRGSDYPVKYPAIVQNLTLADIREAASKVIKPQHLTWLIIGDIKKIEAGIRELNFGEVKILDTEGKEIK